MWLAKLTDHSIGAQFSLPLGGDIQVVTSANSLGFGLLACFVRWWNLLPSGRIHTELSGRERALDYGVPTSRNLHARGSYYTISGEQGP